jgi:hypothetical protein
MDEAGSFLRKVVTPVKTGAGIQIFRLRIADLSAVLSTVALEAVSQLVLQPVPFCRLSAQKYKKTFRQPAVNIFYTNFSKISGFSSREFTPVTFFSLQAWQLALKRQ